jgi:hypothetical protein
VVTSDLQNLQPTDLTNQGGFYPEVINDALDRATIQIQQLEEKVDRSAKLPITSAGDADQLVADIVRIADSADNLDIVATNIDDVNTTADDIANINTVAGSIANVNTTAGSIANVNTVASDIAAVNTVAADLNEPVSEIEVVANSIANVNTVGNAISNVNTVATNIANVNTVAGINTAVTTVANNNANVSVVSANISDVQTVANDLNEPVSEIETVAASIANVDIVGNNIANVNTVAANNTNVTAVGTDIANVNTVATNITNVNTVATNQGDVNVVAANIASVNTAASDIADIIKVADDLNEAVSEIEVCANNIDAIDTVGEDIANVNTVATNIANVNTVAGIAADVTTVAGISANVTTVANNDANVTTVAGISTDVTAVAGVAASVPVVAAINTDVSTVAGIASDVTIAATNVADITNFADVYQGPKSTPPTLRNDGNALQIGDLYFNTVSNAMFVYASTGWVPAGSSVNGTSRRFRYIATAGQTTFTGSDSNGNTMAYDAGFVDVYLNGVRLDQTDYTASSGDSIVLGSAAALNDELNIVAFGTFSVADINGVDIVDGTVSANKLATGAAVSNIGYTPVNKAGDTMTGQLSTEMTPPASNGGIHRIRDTSSTGSNTTFGGTLYSSPNGQDYSVGKKTINSAGYLAQVRADGGELYRRGSAGEHVDVEWFEYGATYPIQLVYAAGFKAQSAFDNPTINLFTVNSWASIFATLIAEVEVFQCPWSNGAGGNIHTGSANGYNSGSNKYVNGMGIKDRCQPTNSIGNVGTLSWSGDTLRYTTNRASNYDHYIIRLRVAANGNQITIHL